MNDAIIYRPYKTQIWALFLTIPIEILALAGAGYCLLLSAVGTLCLTGIGIACLCLTKVLYDSAQRAVFFEKKGLRVIGGSYREYRCIPWDELPYGCYAKNYKGSLFLILSPSALSYEQAKHLANRGANSSRICIDGVVVIYMDIRQDVSQLREFIDNHVARVDTYGL